MSELDKFRETLSRYFQLSEDELWDLYDLADTLYNEFLAKYLEALSNPEKNKELVEKLFKLANELASKEQRELVEDLALIAILDIIATVIDMHGRLVGMVEAEEEEEESEELE